MQNNVILCKIAAYAPIAKRIGKLLAPFLFGACSVILTGCGTTRTTTEVKTDTLMIEKRDTVKVTEKHVEKVVEYRDRDVERIVTLNAQGDTAKDYRRELVYVSINQSQLDSLAMYKAKYDSLCSKKSQVITVTKEKSLNMVQKFMLATYPYIALLLVVCFLSIALTLYFKKNQIV